MRRPTNPAPADHAVAARRPSEGLLAGIRSPARVGLIAVLIVIALSAAYIRYGLRGGQNSDYTDFFLPWYTTLAEGGFPAFSTNFANYNFPYLFLLWLTTYLPVSPLVAVKMIAIAGDVLLVYAAYRLAATVRPAGSTKWAAPAAVALAPSVFLVSGYWGQVDSIFTGFLLLSVTEVLKNRYTGAWVWWGVALGFKLQAIFLLPVLLVVVLVRGFRWFQPFLAAAVFVLLSIPPLFAGNSLAGTFGVYLGQATNQWQTSYGSASVYEWVPDALVSFVGGPGTVLAFAVVFSLCIWVSLRLDLDSDAMVTVAFLGVLITPLLLPYMHDRYFFPATVLSLIVAALHPRLLWAALVLQAVAVWSYMDFLAGGTPVPLVVAPALVIAVVLVVGRTLISSAASTKVDDSDLGALTRRRAPARSR